MKRLEDFIFWILQSKYRKKMVIILTIAVFFASLLMFPTGGVKARMLPAKSAATYSIYVDTPTGSSITQTKQITSCIANILADEKEILDISTFYGQGIPLDYAGLVKGSLMKRTENVAEILINLTSAYDRDEPSFLMTSRLRPILQETCQPLVAGTVIKMIEQPSGPPTLAQIVVEVHGESIERSRKISVEVANILSNTKDLVDIDILSDDIFEKYQLVPNIEKIALAKLGIEQVNNILYIAFQGMAIATKNSATHSIQIPIFLVLSDHTKRLYDNSKDAIHSKLASLTLMNRQGLMIPLTDVVTIIKVKSTPTIMHKDLKRVINVIAETDMVSQVYPLLDARSQMEEYFSKDYNVTNAPFSTYMFDLELKHKKTGEEFLLRWDGEMKVTLDTFRDLGAAFISALVLIFFLLVIYYKSFAISGIILGGSFLSLIGVIIGHWFADIVTTQTFFLTATSLIGFIALMGISSRNSLLLIDYAMGLIKEGMEKQRAIALASATRATPIFLTAIAIILGSALLAGDPIFGGLGVALISGTVAAVFVSLLFVPVLLDNARAICPDQEDNKEDKKNKEDEEPSKFKENTIKILSKIWSLFLALLVSMYHKIKEKINEKVKEIKEKRDDKKKVEEDKK